MEDIGLLKFRSPEISQRSYWSSLCLLHRGFYRVLPGSRAGLVLWSRGFFFRYSAFLQTQFLTLTLTLYRPSNTIRLKARLTDTSQVFRVP